MQSTSYVLRAGPRLRVHVTSSNFPRWDHDLNVSRAFSDCAPTGHVSRAVSVPSDHLA
ncbi:hypothetical protein [Streptomyces sp. SA15]|uniref:hypothetical protein n=1 Tax=Streptomyces sp. SA15 TaxID=934019 RepID=UPI001C530192|nr:hypothetical protein [Streptomyces sp. SA15]